MLRVSNKLFKVPQLWAASARLSTKSPRKPASAFSQSMKIVGELSKFRLSSLVVVTTGAGFICAGGPIDLCTLLAASAGTALCAASAGTFNQVAEKDIDAMMNRTMHRPLPSGKISPLAASAFGAAAGAAGVGLLYAATSPVVAALGLGNIALYAGAYTYSKRRTEMNTWIGAVVGAVPPVMGWLAATHALSANPSASASLQQLAAADPLYMPSLLEYGALVTGEAIALAALLFLWQFPHFFALSWMYREDYARGGFQMVAVNDPTGTRTAGLISEYSLYLTAFPLLTSVLGYTSYMYTIEGTAANMYLLYLAHRFRDDKSNANARRIFLCSLWYLPLLLAGFVFHSRIWNALTDEQEDKDQITDALVGAKAQLKGLCVHERMTNMDHLCAKIASEKAVESATKGADALGEVITQQKQEEVQEVQDEGK